MRFASNAKSLWFLRIPGKSWCSKCMKKFEITFSDKPKYGGYDVHNWIARTHQTHLDTVSKAEKATTATARMKIESSTGVRYSELLRLPYFDVVRHHLIDPMHNLFLGTTKHSMETWKNSGLLSSDKMQLIQDIVDSIVLPPHFGRIPSKIVSGTGFCDLTAEQWKMWTLVYSLYVLQKVLPLEHLKVWELFVEACSLICRPFVRKNMLLELMNFSWYQISTAIW